MKPEINPYDNLIGGLIVVRRALIAAAVIVSLSVGVGVSCAWLRCRPATHTSQEWTPKIGDRVQTRYQADRYFTTIITNIVRVYGDGLPGVDSWWVTPAAQRK